MTLVEITIAMGVMTLAMVMFSGVIANTARLGSEKRQSSVAAHAARSLLERMRCQPFDQVWALYNADPSDDPDGVGTAPGAAFEVAGLEPLADDPDGFVGLVNMPAGEVGLSEELTDETLGMPRDLNGDSLIDAKDHSADYAILPVLITIEWQSPSGPRRLEMQTMLVGMDG
jgi:hypothetical protein